MKTYIGAKIIKAEPMDLHTFQASQGKEISAGDNVHGYHVEYPDGYHSWSPKEVFEAAYREIQAAERSLLHA